MNEFRRCLEQERIVKIQPPRKTIDEESVFQAIFEYALEKYGDRADELFEKYGEEFPENDWELPDETWEKNYLCWLVLEKIMPETGKTIAEEFAETSEELDPNMKMNIFQIRNMIRSDFVVISKKGPFIKIKDMNNKNTYHVMLPENIPPLNPNLMISGRIHPFGDHYRFTGIFLIKTTPLILDPEIFMDAFEHDQIKKIESMRIRNGSTFWSLMNKYPAVWINWMCDFYNIEERLKKDKIIDIESKLKTEMKTIVNDLSADARKIVQICMKQDGFVKYTALKDFEDDLKYFWTVNVFKSPVAELLQKGILFIGKMNIGDRNYKIAFIPIEFREELRDVLRSEDGIK